MNTHIKVSVCDAVAMRCTVEVECKSFFSNDCHVKKGSITPSELLQRINFIKNKKLWDSVALRVLSYFPTTSIDIVCSLVCCASFDASSQRNQINLNLTCEAFRNDHWLIGLLGHEVVHCIANDANIESKPNDYSARRFAQSVLIEGCCLQLQRPFDIYLPDWDRSRIMLDKIEIERFRKQLWRDYISLKNGTNILSVKQVKCMWLNSIGPGYAVGQYIVANALREISLSNLIQSIMRDTNNTIDALLSAPLLT